ncbi:MAG: hypothetical protein IJS66_04250 [Bacteroidales bacterium]|nr:hypothetical protein [Bacteroidales bacterium]
MRKILIVLCLALLPFIVSYAQHMHYDEKSGKYYFYEPNALSFSIEYDIPGSSPEQLRIWADEWLRPGNEFVDFRNSIIKSFGYGDNTYTFTIYNVPLKQKKYSISATVYIYCTEGHYLIEMTYIHGHARGENVMGGSRVTMTSDGTEINRFMFPNFYRRSYWKIRQSIEEDFFPRLCASIHRAMLEHAELEL